MKHKKITSLFGAAAVVALTLTGCSSSDLGEAGGIVDDGCIPLVVATSSEKVNLMTELGQAFKESPEHKAVGECVTVVSTNVASGRGADYLMNSTETWGGDERYAPAIWSPASSVWIDRVASVAGERTVAGAQSFAKTPVVFGVPEPMAKALDYPNTPMGIKKMQELISNPAGWGAHGKDIWGSFKIAKTNPNTSTTGLSTLLMQAYAASGKQADLTVDDVAAAEDFSRVFESGAIHYGDTTGKVLLNLADGGGNSASYVSAIALEETSLYNYNIGNADSRVTQPGEKLTPPKEKLVAVYPEEGSMFSDNPAVVLDAKWVTDKQAKAGEAFLKFLQTPTAQAILPQYGFRPVDDSIDVSKYLNESVGINPTMPTIALPQPEPQVVSAAIDQWAEIRKPSAILELIDISGSMEQSIGNNMTRLDAAIQAANSSIDEVRPTDEIGIWAFTTGLSGSGVDGKHKDTISVVRPFGPLADGGEKLQSEVEALAMTNGAGTPLYDSISAAYDYMKDHAEVGRINAIIVISDGEDTDSKASITSLVQKIQADNGEGGNDKPIRIFAIAYSSGADVASLQKLAKASGGQVFDATDPTKIAEVLRSVMNNF